MNILVTGGCGYLGSILVPTLLREGHRVTVIDNFMYNQTSLLDCWIDPGLTIIRGDVREKALIKEHMKKADVVIPLACLTGAPLCAQDPKGAESIILDAVKMILQLISKDQMVI